MRVIDLSHTIDENMPVYPSSKKPVIKETCSLKSAGYKESQLEFPTHTGTHIDVPAHLLPRGKSIDGFPVDSFFGNAVRIDCRKLKKIPKNILIKKLEMNPAPDFILFYTGWDSYWGDNRYFHGFPVLDHDASEYIASISLKGVGIDTISFDPVSENTLTNHYTLMSKEIILIENLCNLDSVPESGFLFGCLPLKIKGLDGCPVRAFGLLK